MILSDQSLLSLSTLCLAAGADPALHAGTHLRWHLTTDLGFPHAGFRVRSRLAPTWPWKKNEYEEAAFTPNNIATSVAGVHVLRKPLRAENAILTAEHRLYCLSRSKPIRFIYEQRERTDQVFQPWVRFAVVVREGREYSKVGLKGFATRNGTRVEVAEMSDRYGSLPFFNVEGGLRAIFIGYGEMNLVTFEASDDVIVDRVLYTTATFFQALEDWETLTILPPLTAADTEKVVAPADPKALARARLENMRPVRWVKEPGTGGRGLNTPNHHEIEQNLSDQAVEWGEMMKRAYEQEMKEKRPPGKITVSELDGTNIQGAHPDSQLNIPFYGLLQTASFEPHVAAILGLGYFDEEGKDGKRRDYSVDAVISNLWLQYALSSEVARHRLNLEQIPLQIIAHGLGSKSWSEIPIQLQRFFPRLTSFAIDIKAEHPNPVPPPLLQAHQIPDATLSPVQARVELTVSGTTPETRPLVWRAKGQATEQVELDLMPTDVASGQLLAALPNLEGKVNVFDGGLSRYGLAKYGAVNVDSFGRASVVTETSVTVSDQVSPPAPGMPEVTLRQQDSSDKSLFRSSVVSFLWSNGAAAAAEDVVNFDVMWKAGFHSPDLVFNQADDQRSINWPPNSNEGIIRGPEGTRIFLTIDLPTLHEEHRREVTVICIARDRANHSTPSPSGYGIFVDEIKVPSPAQPQEPQWSSWPDARGDVRWRCRWTIPADIQASRVLSASEARILSLSGTDKAAHYALTSAARAAALKNLAIITPNAFMPEELSLPSSIDHADVVMKAGSQDWRVAVIQFIGATGQKSDWPDRDNAFAVIRPRSFDLLSPPMLRIDLQDNIARCTAGGNILGKVDIFTVAHPDFLDAATALGPVAKVSIQGDEDEVAAMVDLGNWHNDWVGFTAWLWTDDGRRSELSPILWRQIKSR